MKIDSITIKNFKGIGELKTDLQKFNVITGLNGSGKSSLLDAIRAGTTGKMPTDAAKTGTVKGGITLEVEKLGELARIWESGKGKTTLNGKATTKDSVMELMKSLFGISQETVNIATSSEVMLGLSSGDFSKYLLQEGFMKIETDINQLVALCNLTPDAENELRNNLPEAPEAITPADIDETYKYYFDLRGAQKKEHAEAVIKSKYIGVIPSRQVEVIKKEHAATLEESGKLKGMSENYQTLQKAYEAHKRTLADTRAQVDKIDCKRPNAQHASSLNEQLAQTRKTITDHTGTIKVLEGNIASLNKILGNLGTSKCPISDKLSCTTDKTAVQGEISENVKSSEEKSAELRIQKEAAVKKEAELHGLLEKEKQNSILYEKKLQLLQQIEALEKADIKEPEKIDVTRLPDLQRRLDYLNEELALAQNYAEAQKAKEKADRTEKRGLIYDELTKALGPKSGIRRIMMESSAAPLADYLNGQLADLIPGRDVKIDTTNGFAVKVGDGTGKTIDFASASTSERTRVALALFDMLNALSGFRILMIDNLDSFDKETLALVLSFIQKQETLDRYDNIFLAGVSSLELESALSSIALPDYQIIRM